MVDTNTRTGKRTPVTLKIKFKSETLEQFIERYAVDVSQGGIFIRTKEPLAVGTQMRFEFQLRDASPLIGGEGTVVWTRENDPSRPAIAPGMGVRFDRLAEGSQGVLERILAEKSKQAPQRPTTDTAKPPLFTDTPTRVAPAPMQDALLGGEKPRRREESYNDQHTPLPKPMPFHSDADEFPEEAFEEATKVRALDELIAQTADGGENVGGAIADELARRRYDATHSDPVQTAAAAASSARASTPTPAPPLAASRAEVDAAPELPSPPERASTGKVPRLLDTSPSPRTEPDAAKTKLGFDPPRTSTGPLGRGGPTMGNVSVSDDDDLRTTRPSGARAVPADPAPAVLPAKKSSAAPILILLLVVVAAAAAGVWFFVLRKQVVEDQAATSDAAAPGSAGSAVDVAAGSAGSDATGGSGSGAAVVAPAAQLVDTPIGATVEKAEVEIVGTDQKGPAPFTAKLEQGKAYKARVTAPGHLAVELDVTGGQADKATATLAPKPRVIAITSKPAGALIVIDNASIAKVTPFEVELTAAQAAKKTVRISLRKGGFRNLDRVIAADAYVEDDTSLRATIDESMNAAPAVVRPTPPTPTPPTETGEPAGSASTPAPTPTPTPVPTETTPPPAPTPAPGAGSATAPSASGAAAKEPEPDFVKPATP